MAVTKNRRRLDQLVRLRARVFPPPATASRMPARPCEGDDRELLEAMFRASNGARVAALWRGDTTGYRSHSEADAALVAHLVWWTRGDAARVDRLFCSSGLFRDKWLARRGASTYGALTIARAIERVAVAA
jgi:putative DNA primase/helicase